MMHQELKLLAIMMQMQTCLRKGKDMHADISTNIKHSEQ